MADTPSFFTHAANFTSAVSGGVDPRTGFYNLSLKLGSLVGNDQLGPSLPITLSYSPLATLGGDGKTNSGFGAGVSLGLSSYDKNNRLLLLSTGERFMVEEDPNVASTRDLKPLTLEQNPLKSVRFEKSADCYRVMHKSGDVEILTGPNNAYDLKVPQRLITATGHVLHLAWRYSDAGIPLLTRVSDDSDKTLLDIVYADDNLTQNNLTTLQFYPDNPAEGYNIRLHFSNANLIRVENVSLGKDQPLIWELSYDSVDPWGDWLVGLSAPGGLKEKVRYYQDGQGQRFPEGAGLPTLPTVYHFEQNPGGGQPLVTVEYAYTDYNYLGYESGMSRWGNDQENLYGVMTSYLYGSTETRTCDGATVTTTRRYNNYHLQVEESVAQSGTTHTTTLEYYAEVGLPFEQQPPQFQFQKSKTVTWQDADAKQRSEITHTVYDQWGNPISKVDPDGTRTEWEYYPADGSDSGCPKDPWSNFGRDAGGQRFIKRMTVTPPASDYADTPAQIKSYQYTGYFNPPSSEALGAILQSEERHYSGNRLLALRTFNYDTAAQYGMLTRCAASHYPNGESHDAYTTVKTFSVVEHDTAQALLNTTTVTTHDALSVSVSHLKSRDTGRIWQQTDAKGNLVTYQYDGLGRQTKRTLNPGTPYENNLSQAYEIEVEGTPLRATTTDAQGNKVRYRLDGLGRQISVEVNDIDYLGVHSASESWFPQMQQNYDALGQQLNATACDTQARQGTSFNLSKKLSYDSWGYARQADYDDGTVETAILDPIAMTRTVSASGSDPTANKTASTGTTKTSYSVNRLPLKIERFRVGSSSPYSTRTMSYDGFKRLRRETDELGRTTQYAYDDWGRLLQTILPDSTVVSRSYSATSPAKWVSEIRVNNLSVGCQAFDGLGRVQSRTVGGRVTRYTYATAADQRPSQVKMPDQVTRQYQYISALGDAIQSVQTAGISQNFDYDKLSGALKSAVEGGYQTQYSHYSSGLLKDETQVLDGQSKTMRYDAYTVGGTLYEYTHIDGAVQHIECDSKGRVKTVSDDAISVELGYDPIGRLTHWTTSDRASQHTATTELTLDDFGRETGRKVTDSSGTSWDIRQQINEKNQITERVTQRDGVVLRSESYRYDERNRLVSWTCSGHEPPCDQYGHALSSQVFSFDPLNNITAVTTTFADGSNDQASYIYNDTHDPCRLVQVNHTHPSYPAAAVMQYDDAGRITDDGSARRFQYDALGRIKHVDNRRLQRDADYAYDAHNRLSQQTRSGVDPLYFYYRANQLVNLVQGADNKRLFRSAAGYTAQHNTGGQDAGVWLTGTDALGSVLSGSNGTKTEQHRYTPYGEEPANG